MFELLEAQNGESLGGYNIGGAVFGVMQDDGVSESNVKGAGVVTNAEGLGYDTWTSDSGSKHYFFFNGRAYLSNGVAVRSDDNSKVFALKLIGSVNVGIQAYRIIPFVASAEDINVTYNGSKEGFKTQALIGDTVYIPVDLLATLGSEDHLYLSVTVGARFNSDASSTVLGIQPKIAFVNDRISAEARYLFTSDEVVREKKAVLQVGFNHLFGHNGLFDFNKLVKDNNNTKKPGDQFGIMISHGQLEDDGNDKSLKVTEALFFYGRNL